MLLRLSRTYRIEHQVFVVGNSASLFGSLGFDIEQGCWLSFQIYSLFTKSGGFVVWGVTVQSRVPQLLVMKALGSFEASGPVNSATQRNIQEDQKLQS